MYSKITHSSYTAERLDRNKIASAEKRPVATIAVCVVRCNALRRVYPTAVAIPRRSARKEEDIARSRGRVAVESLYPRRCGHILITAGCCVTRALFPTASTMASQLNNQLSTGIVHAEDAIAIKSGAAREPKYATRAKRRTGALMTA